MNIIIDKSWIDRACRLERQCHKCSIWFWFLTWRIVVFLECAELSRNCTRVWSNRNWWWFFHASLIINQDRWLLRNYRLFNLFFTFNCLLCVSFRTCILRLMLFLFFDLLKALLSKFTIKSWFHLFLFCSNVWKFRLCLFRHSIWNWYCLFLFWFLLNRFSLRLSIGSILNLGFDCTWLGFQICLFSLWLFIDHYFSFFGVLFIIIFIVIILAILIPCTQVDFLIQPCFLYRISLRLLSGFL